MAAHAIFRLCNACGIQHRRVQHRAKTREAKRLKRSYNVETECEETSCERNQEGLIESDKSSENDPGGPPAQKRTAEVDGVEKRSDVYLLLN